MTLKLSEAIRLGSLLSKQEFNHLQSERGDCALGAALRADGCLIGDPTWHTVEPYVTARWPWATMWGAYSCFVSTCPIRDMVSTVQFVGVIAHLNDAHRWTREAIADWVTTIEPQEVPTQLPQQVEVSS